MTQVEGKIEASGPLVSDGPSYAKLVENNGMLAQIATGGSLEEVLARLCRGVEATLTGVRCCVMIYDDVNQRLNVGAAPSLPEPFLGAISSLAVGPAPGSCNQAILLDDPVLSDAIVTDPLWDGLRETALEHSLVSCWSHPIREALNGNSGDKDAMVPLGTIAFYFDEPSTPSPSALRALETTAALASLAIQTVTATKRLGRHKFYDGLTGLPNRRLFREHLKQSLIGADPHDTKIAIFLLDLDHFKDVNDTFGFTVGDFLLRSVAERLTQLGRPADIISRLGDDEFGLLLGEIGEGDAIREIAADIVQTINRPHDFGGHQLAVTASVGASVYPWDGEDGQTLLRNAQNALSTAKRQGRNRFSIYAPTMAGNAFEKLQLKLALGYALDNHELAVRFQPKVLGNGEIIGCEALLYWNHPSEGVLSPAKFIPLAEESGQILQLGRWVIEQACSQLQRWEQSGLKGLHVAVNISALQFREPGFVDGIASILEEYKTDAAALELEITETIAMTEVEKTMTRLAELRKLGLRISIDDFGTGYSSLSYLKRFPIETLKIDRSFVTNLPEDKENAAIVKAVIALARLMGLQVVAEGVETAAALSFLEENDCEIFQGYHFSPPLEAEKFTSLMHEGLDATSGKSFLRKNQ